MLWRPDHPSLHTDRPLHGKGWQFGPGLRRQCLQYPAYIHRRCLQFQVKAGLVEIYYATGHQHALAVPGQSHCVSDHTLWCDD